MTDAGDDVKSRMARRFEREREASDEAEGEGGGEVEGAGDGEDLTAEEADDRATTDGTFSGEQTAKNEKRAKNGTVARSATDAAEPTETGTASDDGTERTSRDARRAGTDRRGRTTNVKSAWTNHSVYLDDELAGELRTQFKKLDWQLSERYDLDIQKTRHYYPLVVALGLECLEELDDEEIRARIDRATE
jgi:hypothetical protein